MDKLDSSTAKISRKKFRFHSIGSVTKEVTSVFKPFFTGKTMVKCGKTR